MTRFKLTIEYNGAPYSGWQRQAEHPSVQEVLETALEKLNGQKIIVHGAGRTDAGVHATGQVAHIDTDMNISAFKLREAINHHTRPEPVSVIDCEEVSENFHARFRANARHYVYKIRARRPRLTFDHKLAWHCVYDLDVPAMHEAAQALVGKHDFTTFRDVQCQAKSPVKTLSAIRVESQGDEVRIYVSAPSFLHRQVRSITGSLLQVGRGKEDVGYMARILAAADRSQCGPVAPPDGLYLAQVDYPDNYDELPFYNSRSDAED